jgi:hypothetical protein
LKAFDAQFAKNPETIREEYMPKKGVSVSVSAK